MIYTNRLARIAARCAAASVACAMGAALVPGAMAAGEANTAPGAPTGLLVNELESPLNVEGSPRFSWLPQDSDANETQSAYRIQVVDAVTGVTVKNSGIVSSTQQSNVTIDGLSLEAGHTYKWRVQTWDKANAMSEYSAWSTFATGLDEKTDWSGAKWIQQGDGTVQGETQAKPATLTVTGPSSKSDTANQLVVYNDTSALNWGNYTLSYTLNIGQTASAVLLRSDANAKNALMWQISTADGGSVKRHAIVDGTIKKLGSVAVAGGIEAGKDYQVTITVNGATVTTAINGTTIDTFDLTDTDGAAFADAKGTFGFRHGYDNTAKAGESGTYSNFSIYGAKGPEDGKIADVTTADVAAKFVNSAGAAATTVKRTDAVEGSEGGEGAGGAATCSKNCYWYARKTTDLDGSKQVAKAVAYVAGVQDYEISVNGTRLGRGQSFDYASETRYQAWDLTEALNGTNADGKLAIGILNRWYGGGQGRANDTKPGLLVKAVVEYTDGTTQEIVSDGTWRTATGPYSGTKARNSEGDFIEEYNANNAIDGWSETSYDDSNDSLAYVLGAHPTDLFTDVQAELGHVTDEAIKPVSVTRLSDGSTVVDFGKVYTGRFSIDFGASTQTLPTTPITIWTGYELTADGHVVTGAKGTTADGVLANQNTDMSFKYTFKAGKDAQTYDAWDTMGFRYVQIPRVEGVPAFTADDVRMNLVTAETASGRTSTLDTDNEMLDAVYDLMVHSATYSTANQFMDTPTRERGQFLQDSVNISKATVATTFERETSRKAIKQFLASMDRYWASEKNSGRVNSVYPNTDAGRDIPDFTLNLPVWVWNYYMATGDKELLEEAWPSMTKIAGYIERHIATSGSNKGLVTALNGGYKKNDAGVTDYTYGIVDWPSAGRFDTKVVKGDKGARTTVNALSVRTLESVASIAAELGQPEAAAGYTTKADTLTSNINSMLMKDGKYVDYRDTNGKQIGTNGQHSNSYPLAFGIVDDANVETVADFVASKGMKQGPMTADILLESLFDTDRDEDAVKLLTNTEDYGWANLVSRGYTFTWEQWQNPAKTSDHSQSHGWGAAAVADVLEEIAGVEVTAPGASQIAIDPTEAVEVNNATVWTERGAVEVTRTGEGSDYKLAATVPVNVTATVTLPVVEGATLLDNGVAVAAGTITVAADGKTQTVTVGSGAHTFTFGTAETPDPEPEPGEWSTLTTDVGAALGFTGNATVTDGVLEVGEDLGQYGRVRADLPIEVSAQDKAKVEFDWSLTTNNKSGLEFRDDYGRLVFAIAGANTSKTKQVRYATEAKADIDYTAKGRKNDSADKVDTAIAKGTADPKFAAADVDLSATYHVSFTADFTAKTVAYEITAADGTVVASGTGATTATALDRAYVVNYYGNKSTHSISDLTVSGAVAADDLDLPLKGKTMYAFGDSIVAGHKFPDASFATFAAAAEGMTVNRYAANGATIMNNASDGTKPSVMGGVISSQVKNAPAEDPDFVLLEGGTNDVEAITAGEDDEYGRHGKFTVDDYEEDLTATIEAIQAKWPTAKIVFTQVAKLYTRDAGVQAQVHEIQNEVCAKYGVTVADVYSVAEVVNGEGDGVKTFGKDAYSFNALGSTGLPQTSGSDSGTHPNYAGIEKMYVPVVTAALRTANETVTPEPEPDPEPTAVPVYAIDAGARGSVDSAWFEAIKAADMDGVLRNDRADRSYLASAGWGSLAGAKLASSSVTDDSAEAQRDATGLVATGKTLRYRLRLAAGDYTLTAGAARFGSDRAMTLSVSGADSKADIVVDADHETASGSVDFSVSKTTTVTVTLTRTSGANPTLTWLQVTQPDQQ